MNDQLPLRLMWLLLLVPYVGLLWVPFYNARTPELWGFPFFYALTNLDITNRNDPTTTLVAKLIIQLARNGERDPTRLAKRAIEIVRGSS
jgi:hypothetical protein